LYHENNLQKTKSYNRFEIEKLIALGKNNIQIASALSVAPSTISRERNRLKNQPYNAIKALSDSVDKLLDKRYGKTKLIVILNSKILYIHI
jgi:IS30 family transposase